MPGALTRDPSCMPRKRKIRARRDTLVVEIISSEYD